MSASECAHLVFVRLYPGHNRYIRAGKQKEVVLKHNDCSAL